MTDQPHHDSAELLRGSFARANSMTNTGTRTDGVDGDGNRSIKRLVGAQIVGRLHDATLNTSAQALSDAVDTCLHDGLSIQQLCEDYIPEVSRKLGARWCDDTLGFADVTIGCARLLAELRKLETLSDIKDDLLAPQILLIVADDAHHTLGATVVAGVLRRAGLGVQLLTGMTPMPLAQHLERADFDAVFISASLGESIETVRRLVAAARTARQDIMTVVGGTLLDSVGSTAEMADLTKADHVTKDLGQAITLCRALDTRTTTYPTLTSDEG